MSTFKACICSLSLPPLLYYLHIGDAGCLDPRYYKKVHSDLLDSKMTKVFRYQLNQINQQKNGRSPTALVLCAEEDWNEAFSQRGFKTRVFELSKTHTIAFRYISRGSDIQKSIRDIAKIANPPNVLVITGHGNPNSILLSERYPYTSKDLVKALISKNFKSLLDMATSGWEKNFYSKHDVRASDFSQLPRNCQILLLSCCTGNAEQQSCIAEKIAQAAYPRRVFAPKADFSMNACSLAYCQDHNGLELSDIFDPTPKEGESSVCLKIRDSFFYGETRETNHAIQKSMWRQFSVDNEALWVKNAPRPHYHMSFLDFFRLS